MIISSLPHLHYKIAFRQKNYLTALEYAQQFRAFFEKAGDQNGKAESLVLIGNAHYHLGQLERAKEYATAALEKAKQTRDIEMIAASTGLLNRLSNSTVDKAIGANEDVTENELPQEQKPHTILDILDDIAREEEDVRSEPILGLVGRAIEFELLLQDHPFVKEVYGKGVNVNCLGEQKTVPLKVSYIGLAQHYGLKTDMMDFTSDKWVAAFFATNQYTPGGYKPVNKEKYGIIYRYKPLPASPEKISDPNYKLRFETVGLQPLSRPGEQRAFVLRLDKGENMNDNLHMQNWVFQHGLQAAKVIHSRMNQGNSLFPPDELIPLAKKIKETKKFSIKAFDLAWKRHPVPGIDKEKVIHALKNKDIKICNHTLFRFPKDLTRRFTHNWQKEGASRFYDKIVGRAGFMMDSEMAHN